MNKRDKNESMQSIEDNERSVAQQESDLSVMIELDSI